MNRRAKTTEPTPAQTARYADMLAALGTEVRLQILRLLLSAHPGGHGRRGHPVASSVFHRRRCPITWSSLKSEGLVTVQRESTFLRYSGEHVGAPGAARVPLRRMLFP